MPQYQFLNEETGEVVEVFQKMNEPHIYEKDGTKYLRLFASSQLSENTRINPYDSQDFIKKTRNKVGNLGQIMDESAALSKIREDREGVDPVKQKYYENYAKERRGQEHKDVVTKRIREKAAKVGITVED